MPATNNKLNFLNFSQLPDEDAQKLWSDLKEIIVQTERDRRDDVRQAERAMSIWKNDFWTNEDLEFFEEFNLAPYNIPAARAPLNQLINLQRQSRYSFDVVPVDEQSYERYRRGREQFVEENYQDFNSVQEARDYYDRFYDDEYAEAVSIRYNSIRHRNKVKYIESQCFENTLITGLDFLKTVFTTKDNPEGQIQTERRSLRQMFWDHSSVDPMLDDIEYIGEVNRFYKNDLIQLFPQHKEEIEKRFARYTQFKGTFTESDNQSWTTFYDFDTQNSSHRLKVAEMWYQKPDDQWMVVDMQSGRPRMTREDITEAEAWDLLYQMVLDELLQEVDQGQRNPEFFQRNQSEVKADIDNIVSERYDLRKTQVKRWFKTVLTHEGILEHQKSPLPQGGHPYTPSMAQITEGWYTGIMHDIEDLLLAYNKAVMFREVLMANSAKGTLFVDRATLNKSDWDLDSLKEKYTEVGGIIDLELKGNRSLNDVIQQVTTIGQGLAEIGSVINELEERIYRIIGVNDAMMGMAGNEAAASQVRQQIQQGTGNNGLIFDNFARTLETHVADKVIPLVVAELWDKQPSSIRDMSENRARWFEIQYDSQFELFKNAIFSGDYEVKLKTQEVDQQISQQMQAKLLELAQARPDEISVEAALEYDDSPEMHSFIKRNRELMRKKQRQRAMSQIDLQEVQRIMTEQGVDEDTAQKLLDSMRKTAVQQYEQQEQAQTQQGQGMEEIRKAAKETERQNNIEQTTLAGGNE